MSIERKLKSVDLSKITIIGTSINFILGILLAIVVLIYGAISGSLDFVSAIIPFYIVVTSIIGGVVYYFIGTHLFNFFSKKIFKVSFTLDGGKIKKVSVLPISVILTLINLIFIILLYPSFILILEIIVTDLAAVLSYTQFFVILAQVFYLLSQPILLILYLVLVFVLSAIGAYLYNLIATKTGGIVVGLDDNDNLNDSNGDSNNLGVGNKKDESAFRELSKSGNRLIVEVEDPDSVGESLGGNKVLSINGNRAILELSDEEKFDLLGSIGSLTSINSIKPISLGLNLAIAFIIPNLIAILVLAYLIIPISYLNVVLYVIGGFILFLVVFTIFGYLYNYFANKLDPVVVELE
ncbi:MAG: hypothetical protein LBR24_00790 [Methanobrevibacter sp.]|jgi:hypothetical protein|nr:hypothetical protein [Methanobrevibacter sp.]